MEANPMRNDIRALALADFDALGRQNEEKAIYLLQSLLLDENACRLRIAWLRKAVQQARERVPTLTAQPRPAFLNRVLAAVDDPGIITAWRESKVAFAELDAMTRAPRALYEAHCRLLEREPELWPDYEGDLITKLEVSSMPQIFQPRKHHMGNWRIYWKWFKNDREPWPVSGWLTNNSRLKSLRNGSRLWLLISGEACDLADELTYLAEVLCVKSIGNNSEFDPERRAGDNNPRFEVQGKHWVAIDPPLLVEDIIFPDGRDMSVHVGMRLQTPCEMDTDTVRALEARLKKERPDQYRRLNEGSD
jgi:hypothetical protein